MIAMFKLYRLTEFLVNGLTVRFDQKGQGPEPSSGDAALGCGEELWDFFGFSGLKMQSFCAFYWEKLLVARNRDRWRGWRDVKRTRGEVKI